MMVNQNEDAISLSSIEITNNSDDHTSVISIDSTLEIPENELNKPTTE
jgi:hypothetical protein